MAELREEKIITESQMADAFKKADKAVQEYWKAIIQKMAENFDREMSKPKHG